MPNTTADPSPERWQQIQDLFHRALEQEPAARPGFLASACPEDEALRAEVEGLLAVGDDADARIHEALGSALELLENPDDADSVRQRIGPYQILRELGRGGMSTVYLADRDDQHFRKRVAVKVVRPGMDSREILQRLRQERQILAHLEHPYIAKLLDGGNTEDGIPYFVMEYVPGQPIDEYCDQQGLTLSARLQLFRRVCAAVDHAHRNLVVHRDLKPNNILVTADGRPKLLDFGIAKLLDPTVSPEPVAATVAWLRLLTPAFASPEQIRGAPLTTASDIYSLGVLLYLLLTGQPPYRVDRLRPSELERLVCEVEPPPPSAVAENGARRLRGDLDTIVLKALRKEPHRRYASVARFSEDLERYLKGRPVSARRDTVGYRARKFFQRHRLAVSSGLLVVAAVVILVSFYTVRLAAERDRALQEESKAQQIVAFLGSLFAHVDPSRSRGAEVTAREVLDLGSARIRQELAEQPEVRADLIDLMGTVYQSLGLYDDARPLLRESLALRQTLHGPDHPEVAESLHHQAQLLLDEGQLEAAEQMFRQALAQRRQLLGNDHPAIAHSLSGLAALFYARRQYETAEELFAEALALRRRLFDGDHADLAASLNDLGATRYGRGDLEGAEPLLREALGMRQRLHGDLHPATAETLSALAALRYDRDDEAEAERLYQRVLEIRRQLFGPTHVLVAYTLSNHGEMLRRRGDYEAAEPRFRQALMIIRQAGGEDHPRYGEILENLARTLLQAGAAGEAEPLWRQSLALTRKTLGPEDPRIAWTLINLGDALRQQDQLQAAETAYGEALALRRRDPTPSWRLATPLVRLGETRLARGDPDQAEAVLREAVAILRQELPDHHRLGEAMSLLGASLLALGRGEEAGPLLQQGYDLLRQTLGDDDATTSEARRRLEALGVAASGQGSSSALQWSSGSTGGQPGMWAQWSRSAMTFTVMAWEAESPP